MNSKFNVSADKTKRTYDGIIFDSAAEMRYYKDVILPGMQNGSIVSYERQKKYILQPDFIKDGKKIQPIVYKADFTIQYTDGREQVIDIKGCADPQAKIKRKMFWYVYPNIDYIWMSYSKIDGGWVLYETAQEGRKLRKQKAKEIEEK